MKAETNTMESTLDKVRQAAAQEFLAANEL